VANYSDAIHNAIVGVLLPFSFPIVTYDPDTRLRTTSTTTGETPETVLVREQSSAFDDAEGERRTPRLRERTDWSWEAEIAFDGQVSLELFEETYTDSPIFLPRTAELDQQVVVTIGSVEYVHPPEHQSSSGTRATITFAASLSRK
jgi:hypothetical protein